VYFLLTKYILFCILVLTKATGTNGPHKIGVSPSPASNPRQGYNMVGNRGNSTIAGDNSPCSVSPSKQLVRKQDKSNKASVVRKKGPNWEDIGISKELKEHGEILVKHFVRQKLFSKVKFITTERQLQNTGMYLYV
jgi:hypothetical protein